MFERLRAGWRLARSVRKAVSRDRGLFIYPVFSGLVSFAVFIIIFGTLLISIPLSSGNIDLVIFGAIILIYIITGFISTLVLLALLIAFRASVSGSPVSFRKSLSEAWGYRKQAIEWSLFYTVIIMLLRIIESRFRGAGQMVVGAIGAFTIAVATFFAVPAILDYRCTPIEAVKRSVSTIRRNFGETFGGVAYVDLYTICIVLAGFAAFIAGIVLISFIPALAAVAIIILGIAVIAFGMILNYTYLNVLKLILFDYVGGKGLPAGFNVDDINSAVKNRGSGRII
ncbi:MAG: DUF6159 family protein [Thermoplasmataceae archaeon]